MLLEKMSVWSFTELLIEGGLNFLCAVSAETCKVGGSWHLTWISPAGVAKEPGLCRVESWTPLAEVITPVPQIPSAGRVPDLGVASELEAGNDGGHHSSSHSPPPPLVWHLWARLCLSLLPGEWVRKAKPVLSQDW